MIRALCRTEPWRLVLLTSLLAPWAVLIGVIRQQTGGVISLMSLSLPIFLVALSGHVRWLVVAVSIGAAGILTETFVGGGPEGISDLFFAGVLVCVLAGTSGVLGCTVRALRMNSGDEAGLAEGSSSTSIVHTDQHRMPSKRSQIENGREFIGSPEAAVQFYVLLETLEDIGRLMSMNFDLDTLIPAINSTATSSLKCRHCEVYVWDANRQMLVNPLPKDQRSSGRFIPNAENGIGEWVMRERQTWTRSRNEELTGLEIALGQGGRLPDAVAPLTAGMELLGLLVVDGVDELSPNLEQMLATLANIYGLGIRNAHLFQRVEEMARRDGLTGLYNHATFQQNLRTHVVNPWPRKYRSH